MNLEKHVKNNIKEIINMALSIVSQDYDAIVYYDTLKNEFFTSTTTLEDKNNLKEIYRLKKGFDCGEVAGCMECDHLYTCDNNWEGDGEYQLIECTINKLVDDFNKN